MDLHVGQTLGGRYEIIDLIGEGGMALVYKANDRLLNRIVAVKVLRPQFAVDLQFVERFRREAQAAASLSHPNIVNIYDVGQDDKTHFIIMEYVEGKNLKDIIIESAPLPVDQVVNIGIQICRGLEHAHAKNLIHRDIKPHNILITADGVVKVTDFGIARAVSSSSLTDTGTIIGSVHYSSPEQAKGTFVGPQSDLYSLGIVLYELLTKKVPYTGDSPIAIAIKHTQEGIPSVRMENPRVPLYFERIIQKAMAKNLADRYRSAGEIRQDLERVLRSEQSFVKETPADQSLEETKVLRRSLPRDEEDQKVNSGSLIKKLLLALLFLAIAGLTFIFVILPTFVNVEEVMVPRLVGLSLPEAEQTLARIGISLEVQRKLYDSQVPQNHIIDQDPRPNRWMKVNRKVKVIVSLGPELSTVPDLIGLTAREAQVAISDAGLMLGTQQTGFSDQVPEGRVMLQDPSPFAKVSKGSKVQLTFSKGPTPDLVTVPDCIGLHIDQALTKLQSAGLVPGRIIKDLRGGLGLPPGTVLDQNPPLGVSVAPGSSVDLVVSPEPIVEPEVPVQEPSSPEPGPVPEPEPTPEPGPEPAPDLTKPQTEPVESPFGEVKRAEVQILVPPGPVKQLVQIILIDDYPAREVYSKLHAPGERIVQVVEGHGSVVKLQVYIDGVMYKEQTFKD